MRSIGQANVESETPYRCHIICHMDPFMIKYISNTSGAFIEYRKTDFVKIDHKLNPLEVSNSTIINLIFIFRSRKYTVYCMSTSYVNPIID